jgi:arginine decarboxylase
MSIYIICYNVDMKIHVTHAIAQGKTELAAFDACLQTCGIADQNLIYLSSIIPPKSEISFDKPVYKEGHFGNRLYVVIASQRESRPNHQAWAGIGWVTDPETSKGLFVEHEGMSEEEVRQDITETLYDMMARRNHVQWSDIKMVVEGAMCGDRPVCAMVVAVYQSEDWK